MFKQAWNALLQAAKSEAAKSGNKIPTPDPRMGKAIGGLVSILVGGGMVSYGVWASLYTIDVGKAAVVFNRLTNSYSVTQEGTHIRIPYFEQPYVFDTRTNFETFSSHTGTRDLQMVDISLRVLYRPNTTNLPQILQTMGPNFASLILPSIVNETLKSVVAQYNAGQLITQREQVSKLIRRNLIERATDFSIIIEDVSITHTDFGKEFMAAVEAKQVAQQQAEQAKFVVKQAIQDKLSKIIKAEGEAKSAEMIGQAVAQNPGYIELRQLDAAKEIATKISTGNNQVYLSSDALLQSILNPTKDEYKQK